MTSTIRLATEDDAGAIARLLDEPAALRRLHALLVTRPGQHYALILDEDDGSLAAAAVVTIADRRGHIDLLAVSPHHAEDDVARRMIGVAEALCSAYGCGPPDVIPDRRVT